MHEDKVRKKYLKKQGVYVCRKLWESFWLHAPADSLFTHIYVPAPVASTWGTDTILHGQPCLSSGALEDKLPSRAPHLKTCPCPFRRGKALLRGRAWQAGKAGFPLPLARATALRDNHLLSVSTRRHYRRTNKSTEVLTSVTSVFGTG